MWTQLYLLKKNLKQTVGLIYVRDVYIARELNVTKARALLWIKEHLPTVSIQFN